MDEPCIHIDRIEVEPIKGANARCVAYTGRGVMLFCADRHVSLKLAYDILAAHEVADGGLVVPIGAAR